MTAAQRPLIDRCPVIGSPELRAFFSADQLPVLINVLYPDAAAAKAVTRGDIELCYCPLSGHIFNRRFDARLLDYSLEYDNALHFSPRFREYATALITELLDEHSMRGKTIVEVGCGKGEFLRQLCRAGNNRGYGFDPSYRPAPGAVAAARADGVTFVRGLYDAASSPPGVDLVLCQHTLEHIEDPRAFLEGLRDSVEPGRDPLFFFEVPNALFTLRDLAIWDIIYEHCGYFTPTSLRTLFASCGFEVHEVRERYDGQFLTVTARRSANAPGTVALHREARAELGELVASFERRYQEKFQRYRADLARARAAGRTAAVWGAGSKGITFLNLLGDDVTLRYAIDLNPAKHGRHVAGSAHPIHAPDILRTQPVDMILIMNPIYADEIRAQVRSYGLDPEFWVM